MQSHNLLEEQFGYILCIGHLLARNKVRYLEELIIYHEDGIHSLLCARKSQHEIRPKSFQISFGTGKSVYKHVF